MLGHLGKSLAKPRLLSVADTQLHRLEPQFAAINKDSNQIGSLAGWLLNSWQNQAAGFSVSLCHPAGKEETASEGEGSQQGNAPEEGHTGGQWRENTAPDPYADLSREQLASELQERDGALSASAAEVEEKVDQVKRTLADMENLRQRSARQAETTQKFAIQKFLKSMLDTGDNLERAYTAVPQEALQGQDKDGNELSAEALVAMLNSLTNGVKLTERIFDQGLRENGVEKSKPLGEKFDPNLHEALFEIPDPSKEAGTIGAVTKTGYTLAGRVVRPAQVGVIRGAPQESSSNGNS